jgi:hypothetical protein
MISAQVVAQGFVWELRLNPQTKTAEVVSVTAQRPPQIIEPLASLEPQWFGQPPNLRVS